MEKNIELLKKIYGPHTLINERTVKYIRRLSERYQKSDIPISNTIDDTNETFVIYSHTNAERNGVYHILFNPVSYQFMYADKENNKYEVSERLTFAEQYISDDELIEFIYTMHPEWRKQPEIQPEYYVLKGDPDNEENKICDLRVDYREVTEEDDYFDIPEPMVQHGRSIYKGTFEKCINYMEQLTNGQITVDDVEKIYHMEQAGERAEKVKETGIKENKKSVLGKLNECRQKVKQTQSNDTCIKETREEIKNNVSGRE